jgi:Ca2+-transporting ATPase
MRDTTLAPPPGWPGLTSAEAAARLRVHGPNRLVPEDRRPPWLSWLLHPLTDPMVVLLLLAAATYLLLGDYIDATVSLAAVVPIALVSLVLELRAERTLERLRQLTAPKAAVWRDGRRQVIPAEEIVPGDVLFLQEGDIIPADGLLVAGQQVMVDESSLTGESQPVAKSADGAESDHALFAGTTVLSGRGIAVVTVTGAATRYGRIGALVAGIRQPSTPLQRLIRRLIGQLAAVAALFSLGVLVVELLRGSGWGAAVIAAVSLAIAAIPEEFPMVFTLYLTLGAWRLARRRALIRRLVGVETLGSTTVICTDKTGTLTQGHLEVAALVSDGQTPVPPGAPLSEEARRVLEAALLASEPHPFDPLEQALVRYATAHGVEVSSVQRGELLADYPFDPVGKYVTHVWRRDGQSGVYAKGSIEGILARCVVADTTVQRWRAVHDALAERGMRVIAVASGDLTRFSGERATDERALRLCGLIAFSDPVRPGVPEALAECRAAGIRVIMITGDHPATARAVAADIGLPLARDHPVVTGDEVDAADEGQLAQIVRRATVFARARPEQKYRLVRALRAQGEVTAMTGDGINDAPALREADIGVAMGQRGTEVARAAATMVLLDDNFATIVAAVREGRRIFENLRRSFAYLIAFHPPLLLAALVVPLLGQPLLLLPVHLVWLELIVHPTASLVFEADPASPELMRRPPRRPGRGMLAAVDFARAVGEGVVLSIGVLILYLGALGRATPLPEARSLALAAMIFGQSMLVLLERSPDRPLWQASLRGNRVLPLILAASVGSVPLAVLLPAPARLLKLAPLDALQWATAAAVALAFTLWVEPLKAWRAARTGLTDRGTAIH